MSTRDVPSPRVVPFFNGGLFTNPVVLPLGTAQLTALTKAAESNWSYVDPHIFGSVFQGIMDDAQRHASGAHYTAHDDIMRVVGPTIVDPWRKRIQDASSLRELLEVRAELLKIRGYDFKSRDGAKRHSAPLFQRQHQGSRLALTFLDLVEVLFVKAFLDHGVSIHTVRLVQREAAEEFGVRHPFCVKRFETDGETIVLRHRDDAGMERMLDRKRKQWLFVEVFNPLLRPWNTRASSKRPSAGGRWARRRRSCSIRSVPSGKRSLQRRTSRRRRSTPRIAPRSRTNRSPTGMS